MMLYDTQHSLLLLLPYDVCVSMEENGDGRWMDGAKIVTSFMMFAWEEMDTYIPM